MFNFFKKKNDSVGKIDEAFGWMTLEAIMHDLEDGNLNSKKVATCLIRFAIYGGLFYKNNLLSDNEKLKKNMLSKNSNLLRVDPDKITAEAIAFIWTMISFIAFKTEGIYEDDELATQVTMGNEILVDVLKRSADYDMKGAFSSRYMGIELIKSSEKLAKSVQEMASMNLLDPDTLYINISTKIFVTSVLDGILSASKNLLKIHLKPDAYDL